MDIGSIIDIDRSKDNGSIVLSTDKNKRITLTNDLPFRKHDIIIVNNDKLLFLINPDNNIIINKAKDNITDISNVIINTIVEESNKYIKATNYNITLDQDKVLSSFYNNISWNNYYNKLEGYGLYDKIKGKVPASSCKFFLEWWFKEHLLRQLNLWGISNDQSIIMLEDYYLENPKSTIEDFMITIQSCPYRFLYINDTIKEEHIESLRILFDSPKITIPLKNLKRRLSRSISSYIEFNKGDKYILGNNLFNINKYGMMLFDNNSKICYNSIYNLEYEIYKHIKRKITKCNYDWKGKTSLKEPVDYLTYDQINAVEMVMSNEISVITGGPGTGKTKVIHSIIKECKARNILYHVAAFTGKAVGRVKETAFPEIIESSTIDMMLVKGPEHYKFNLLILEEASMITMKHIYKLFQKFNPLTYKIVLVGDLNQIPPIEKGQFFCSMIWSKRIPYVRLEKNFRIDQHFGGDIVRNAYKIIDPFRSLNKPIDFDYDTPSFNIMKGDLKLLRSILIKIYEQGTEIDKFTVLSPYNEEVDCINSMFQDVRFRESGQSIYDPSTRTRWYLDDKIMCIRNNSTHDFANGDIGKIVEIGDDYLRVTLDKNPEGRLKFNLKYKVGDLQIKGNLKHAYCLTINKSQGSEYETVVLYLASKDTDDFFLNLNLIYTAITRAKKMVWIICEDYMTLLKACNNKLNIPNDILRLNIMSYFKEEFKGDIVERVEDFDDEEYDYDYEDY